MCFIRKGLLEVSSLFAEISSSSDRNFDDVLIDSNEIVGTSQSEHITESVPVLNVDGVNGGSDEVEEESVGPPPLLVIGILLADILAVAEIFFKQGL